MPNPRNDSLLNEMLSKCERLVNKNYLNTLHNLTFCLEPSTEGAMSLLEIETLGESLSPEFFTFVLNAIGNLGEVFGYMLKSYRDGLILYVGLKTTESRTESIDILKNGLKSSYPSSKFRELSPKESSFILMDLFDPNCYQALSSAIVIPDNRSSSNAPINQKLVDLMGNEDFVAFFLASPCLRFEVKCLIDELQDIYTTLSSFSETQYDFSHSLAKSTSIHITDSNTESTTDSCTETHGVERAYSTSHYTLITPAAVVPVQDLSTFNISISFNQTEGIVNVDNQFIAKADVKTYSDTHAKIHITAGTDTKSDAISYTTENKKVIDLLVKLDELITRLSLASENPLFYFGAYFLSSSYATSIRAAFTYSGLAKDSRLNSEGPFITTWKESESVFSKLIEELRSFNHLCFAGHEKDEYLITATPITTAELLNSFYFPYLKKR